MFDPVHSLENGAFLTADIVEYRNKLDCEWERICKKAVLNMEAIIPAEFLCRNIPTNCAVLYLCLKMEADSVFETLAVSPYSYGITL